MKKYKYQLIAFLIGLLESKSIEIEEVSSIR